MRPRLMTTLVLASTLLVGCATQQVRFEPWKNVPDADAALLKHGVLAVAKDKLLDAVATTLEHEPYLHWSIDSLDKANGLVTASAGLLREVQIRVADAQGASGTAQTLSSLSVNVPRRELKTQAKIWIKKADGAFLTAYEPAAEELDKYNVVQADVVLDDAYFASFVYRVLHDRSQVPFSLHAYDGPAVPADALAPPAASAQPAAVPVDQAPAPSRPAEDKAGASGQAHMPVREDAVGNTTVSGKAPLLPPADGASDGATPTPETR